MCDNGHSAALTTACAAPVLSLPTLAPRTQRIIILLLAILAMSVADLYLTLLMLQTVGLAEENPIARFVIALDSPGLLTLWKLSTVSFAAALIIGQRARPIAEIAAWAGVGILAAVMLHWSAYAAQTDEIMRSLHLLQEGFDERWIAMTPR